MVTIYKHSFFKYLVFEGKELGNIKIFDPNTQEVLHSEGIGWIGGNSFGEQSYQIVLDECINKRKLKLDSKIPFVIKDNTIKHGARYSLYIPSTLCNYKSLGEQKQFENETETYYYNYCSIELVCQMQENGPIEKQRLRLSEHSRIVKNDFGNSVEQWEEKLKEDKIDISRYNLQELLKKYDLVEKKSK